MLYREQTATGVETEQKMDLKAVTTALTTVMIMTHQVSARPIAADWDRVAEMVLRSLTKPVRKARDSVVTMVAPDATAQISINIENATAPVQVGAIGVANQHHITAILMDRV